MKSQYDRPAIKLEYYQSDFDEVYNFLKRKFGEKLVKSLKNRVKGWTNDKKEWKQKIIDKAIEDHAKKQAKSLELTVEFLKQAKKNALIKIAKQITQDELISMKDLVRWLWTIKTELWEPTKITKNENNNTNNEELTDEDKAILDKIFGNKWNE